MWSWRIKEKEGSPEGAQRKVDKDIPPREQSPRLLTVDGDTTTLSPWVSSLAGMWETALLCHLSLPWTGTSIVFHPLCIAACWADTAVQRGGSSFLTPPTQVPLIKGGKGEWGLPSFICSWITTQVTQPRAMRWVGSDGSFLEASDLMLSDRCYGHRAFQPFPPALNMDTMLGASKATWKTPRRSNERFRCIEPIKEVIYPKVVMWKH